ncbi:hypothetical protein [Paraburkholderia sp. J10-1]|uniref:hypothetical protein n=1 Tax=Paraburkholderia sp. J10-1 TaxID=2805430 RepID=UPI002AB69B90|nr:hypothetical protein [Paraburkholderia sp. J10-1]
MAIMIPANRKRRVGAPYLAAVCVAIAGCACDRLADSAGVTAKYITAFQVDLTTLQADLTDYQKGLASINGERVAETSRDLATAGQAENVMALLACTTPGAVYSTLQSQGTASLSAELTAAPVQPSPAPLPTDKLAAVATSLSALSKKPGRKENLEFLVAYGQSVGTSLNAPSASPTTGASAVAASGAAAGGAASGGAAAQPAKPGAKS